MLSNSNSIHLHHFQAVTVLVVYILHKEGSRPESELAAYFDVPVRSK